jgi:hypothetical protein
VAVVENDQYAELIAPVAGGGLPRSLCRASMTASIGAFALLGNSLL